jgi:anti-sigma-K factor RskA
VDAQTRAVQFGAADDAPHGRVFVQPGTGLVFVGSNLPSLPQDRTFEFWIVPPDGTPRPAGLFQPDQSGSAVHIYRFPAPLAQKTAVAVSVEPSQGSSSPTTKPFIIVPL